MSQESCSTCCKCKEGYLRDRGTVAKNAAVFIDDSQERIECIDLLWRALKQGASISVMSDLGERIEILSTVDREFKDRHCDGMRVLIFIKNQHYGVRVSASDCWLVDAMVVCRKRRKEAGIALYAL